ncbi:MAG: response regulator transcription factor [Lautropia sp.]|nr:response regulator transcription factor [Lautropia sp.]
MSTTVLLVDDHPLMRSALRSAIETICEDCIFIPAASLEEAFHEVRLSNPPDLVILDLNLPDACGTATLDAFRRRCPGLKLVVLSERTDPPTIQAARNAGVVGFIPKTASVEQFINSLRQIMGGMTTLPPASPPAPIALAHPDSIERLSRHPEAHDTKVSWQIHGSIARSAPPTEAGVDAPIPSAAPTDRVHLTKHSEQTANSAASGSVNTTGSNPSMSMMQASPMPAREYHDGRHLGLTERQRGVLRLMILGLPNKAICRELHLAEGTVKVHVSAVLRALGVASRAQVVVAALRAGIHVE